MVKKIIIMLIICLLMISFVNATSIYKNVYTFNECDKLYINVSGTLNITEGEYSFPLCDELTNNYWFCECYDNYNLTMKHDIRTINNYTFIFDVKIEIPNHHSSLKILKNNINKSINKTSINKSINKTSDIVKNISKFNNITNITIDNIINKTDYNIPNNIVNNSINDTYKDTDNNNKHISFWKKIENIYNSIIDFLKNIFT